MANSSLKPVVTYTGLVDDFAKNHGDECIHSLQELNEYLISAVLIGHPVLINDGHVVMHPAIREAILKPESSPLRNLVATGYVKILTRNDGDLEGLATRMADEGITSAQRFSLQREYADSYLPALHVWMSQLRLGEPQSFLRPWPELDTSAIFHQITRSALRKVRDALVAMDRRDELESLRRFRDLYEMGRQHRRTDWENVANRMRGGGRLSDPLYRELMYAANEAYQYSWGCALAHKTDSVRVETRAPKFTSLDVPAAEPRGSSQDLVEVYTPDFGIADRKIGDNWSRLADVARLGTETYYAKVEFQRQLDSHYADPTEVDRREMDAAAKKYSKALSKHFKTDERARLIYGYISTVAGAALGIPTAPLGLWVGTGIGLAVGVALQAADQAGVPRAIMKVFAGGSKTWITSNALGTRPTIVSNFQIDQAAADQYRRGAPEFKLA